jgi:putative sigma-54 modulation protein
MQITITARRFRAHASIREHAADAINNLAKFYDGIVHADVILSFERASDSVKAAEVNVHVYGATLSAKEKSDDYIKSIDKAVGKIERQLTKYKDRLKLKDRKVLARVKRSSGATRPTPPSGSRRPGAAGKTSRSAGKA